MKGKKIQNPKEKMTKKMVKKISGLQVLYAVIALLALGGFIIISSGMFDVPDVASQQQQHNHPNNNLNAKMGSSVDLKVINEINNLEETVKNNPGNHEAILSLGHLLNDNGFYDRAIKKYETYLTSHSDNADVIVDLGVCYFELKNYDKAISVIKSALEINPKHQIANFNLGIVNLANNNPTEAKAWWTKSRDIDPNSNIGKKSEELLKTNN